MAPGLCLQPKLMKRFYEVLVLLRVLSQVQGERINGDSLEGPSIDHVSAAEARRKAMYHLCVMGDFLKGGYTVTAMASENLPHGPRYWIATNGNLEKISAFLRETLKMLEAQARSTPDEHGVSICQDKLFEKFVGFQKTRIKQYWRLLQPCIQQELKRVKPNLGTDAQADEYSNWLRAYEVQLNDHRSCRDLSLLAYESRHSKFLRVEFDPVTGQTARFERESFTNMRHYIGRLCAPIRAAVLLSATQHHASLFEGFSLKSQSSGSSSPTPIAHAHLSLEGLSGRMFAAQSGDRAPFLEALLSLDRKGSIHSRVLEWYQDRNWKPRVHAELSLLEALHDEKIRFYDSDKYIACSKAACFCCYHYICGHPGVFVRPSCHNKLYLNWKPPDLNQQTAARHAQQQEIMNGLIKQVRQAVIDRVSSAHDASQWHPDSSTGITVSAIVSQKVDIDQQDVKISHTLACYHDSSPASGRTGNSDQSSDESSEDGGVSLLD